MKTIFYSFVKYCFHFSPLEDKIHIFAPPCNILYILYGVVTSGKILMLILNKVYVSSKTIHSRLYKMCYLYYFDVTTCDSINFYTGTGIYTWVNSNFCLLLKCLTQTQMNVSDFRA